MNQTEFNEFREVLNEHCTKILGIKKEEYATDGDRLRQFKIAGVLNDCHPVRALTGLMSKHETSIHDMSNAVNNGESYSADMWIEKIGDLRNYCDLLYALLIDKGEI